MLLLDEAQRRLQNARPWLTPEEDLVMQKPVKKRYPYIPPGEAFQNQGIFSEFTSTLLRGKMPYFFYEFCAAASFFLDEV